MSIANLLDVDRCIQPEIMCLFLQQAEYFFGGNMNLLNCIQTTMIGFIGTSKLLINILVP